MSKRYQGGILGVGFNPLQAPNAPTGVSATAGDASASVSFTAPTNVGGSAITGYTVQSNPGGFAGSGASSPITVSGLSNGTSYTFNVWALNSYGPSPAGGPSGSVTPEPLQRALFGGGTVSGATTAVITSLSINSLGNSSSFGNLTVDRYSLTAFASSTRGVFAGGDRSGAIFFNVIDYVTIASAGNATNFGTLTANGRYALGGASNETRGLTFAGYNASTNVGFLNVIDYVTIATTGDATSFGNLSIAPAYCASCGSSTRAVVGGGYDGSNSYLNISYVTIASTGNGTNFGNLSVARFMLSSCSSSTRGLFAGGRTNPGGGAGANDNTIDYITIASTGNATDFGDLSVTRAQLAAASSSTRAVFGGGQNTSGTRINTIDYVTIASTGNAASFGSLTAGTAELAATSNVHGGL